MPIGSSGVSSGSEPTPVVGEMDRLFDAMRFFGDQAAVNKRMAEYRALVAELDSRTALVGGLANAQALIADAQKTADGIVADAERFRREASVEAGAIVQKAKDEWAEHEKRWRKTQASIDADLVDANEKHRLADKRLIEANAQFEAAKREAAAAASRNALSHDLRRQLEEKLAKINAIAGA